MTATHTQDKLMRQLGQAYAEKVLCSRTLSSRAAHTQDPGYRSALEEHRNLTNVHARKLKRRLETLGEDTTAEDISARLAASAENLTELPLDLIRFESDSERLLRSAREQCAVEAREIATYYVLESIASELGDKETARLCSQIRAADERAFFDHLHGTIPGLVTAMVHTSQPPPVGAQASGVARAAGGMVRHTLVLSLRLARTLDRLRQHDTGD